MNSGPRKLSAWAGWADNHAWSLLGHELRDKAIEVLGKEKAINVQFGNLIGWLRDRGEYDLEREIREAIKEYNAQFECPECGMSLQDFEGQRYCEIHGIVG